MKKLLTFVSLILLVLMPVVSLAQFTGQQGGTGVRGISDGSIPYGGTSLIRLATSSAFQFNPSLSRLTVTNASTTNISASSSISLQGWVLSTSTVVCMAPEQCEFQADGVADDATYNTAASYLDSVGGGQLYIKGGTFVFENAGILYDNVEVIGTANTVLKRASSGSFSALLQNEFFAGSSTSRNTNIKIRNITFDGGGDTNSYNQFRHAIGIYGVDDFEVSGCRFINLSGDGIYISSTNTTYESNFFRAENVRIYGNHFAGENLNRNGISVIDAQNIAITTNTFYRMATTVHPAAIDLEPNSVDQVVRNVTISSNTFEQSHRGVLAYNAFGATTDGLTISNNTFNNSLLFDIDLISWVNINVGNNISRTPAARSIEADGVSTLNLVGNTFYFPQSSAIYVEDSGEGTNISSNLIINPSGHGIWFNNVNKANIVGNSVRNWGVASTTFNAVYGEGLSNDANIVGNTFNDVIGSHTAVKSFGTSDSWNVANNKIIASTTYSFVGSNNVYTSTLNGNLGIGTSTPGSKLSVAGPILGSSFSSYSNTEINSLIGTTTIGTTSPLLGKLAIQGAGGNLVSLYSSTGAGRLTISDAGSITMLPASGNTFIGNSTNNSMKFDGSGTYITSIGSSVGGAFLIDTDNNSTNARFIVGMNSSDPDTATALLTVLETMFVGINTTVPSTTLHVVGTTTSSNLILSGLSTNTSGNAVCIVGTTVVTAGGTTCVTSSERFKTDIALLTDWRDIFDIDVVQYNYKPEYADNVRDAGGKRLGFIAEQIEEVDPRLVQYDTEGNPLSVHFDGITAKTVLAIQEMQKEIDGITGKAKQSTQDNWQWVCIALLTAVVIRQHLQVKKLLK